MSIAPDLLAWLTAADRVDGMRVDLLTVAPRGFPAQRWTTADKRVMTVDGRVFTPGPGIERSRIRLTSGIQVSDMDLTLFYDELVTIGGIPMFEFAERGLFDGADVLLEWAYFDAAGTFKGSHARFSGQTAPAEFEMGRLDFKVRSAISKLNVAVPSEVYQPGCLNQLFDARCGLDPDDYVLVGTVTGIGTGRAGAMTFTAAGLTQDPGYFDLGVIEFLSGPNDGVLRTVKAHGAGGVLSVAMAWPATPLVGDTFNVVPGCNRTLQRCVGTFNNRARFRGTPFVPAPETVA